MKTGSLANRHEFGAAMADIRVGAYVQAVCIAFFLVSDYQSFTQLVLVSSFIWTAVLIVSAVSTRNRVFPLVYLSVWGFTYTFGISFSIPLVSDAARYSWNTETQTEALYLGWIGLVAYGSAAVIVSRSSIFSGISIWSFKDSPSRMRALAVVCMVLGILGHSLDQAIIAPVFALLSVLGFLGVAMTFVVWLSPWKSPTWFYFGSIGVLGLFALFKLGTGLASQLVSIYALWAILYFSKHRRVQLWLLALGSAIFISSLPIKHGYRDALRVTYGLYMTPTSSEKLDVLLDTLNTGQHLSLENFSESVGVFFNRSSNLIIFARVANLTPTSVPHLEGETYKGLLFKLIPRLVWPEKPVEFLANDFGHLYGFLDLTDDLTSVNMPWMVEGYVNFGVIGVLAICSMMGGLLVAFDNIYNWHIGSESDKLIPAIIGLSFVWPESHFSGLVGGMLQAAIVFYLTLAIVLGIRVQK